MSIKSLTGINTGYFDELIVYDDLTTNSINTNISNTELQYIDGLTSSAQVQINYLQNEINTLNGGSNIPGGFFMAWWEATGGFSPGSFQWSMGGSGAANVPIVLGFPCNLISMSCYCSSIPATSGTIQIYKNGVAYVSISGINTKTFNTDFTGLSFTTGDTITIYTTSGSGGGVIRACLSFSSNGVIGPTGISGSAATIAIGTVTTLAYGNAITVTNSGTTSDAILNFELTQGQKGDKGDQGEQGPIGSTPNISIGTVTELEYGNIPAVVLGGTVENPILNFQLVTGQRGPRGEKGDRGSDGADGATGATGPAGPSGSSGPDVGSIISSVMTGAAMVAIEAQIAALSANVVALDASVAALDAAVAAIDINLSSLNEKTFYQSVVGASTKFSSDVGITSGISSNITLRTSGQIDCLSLTNAGTIETNNMNVNNNLYVAENANITGSAVSIGPTSQLGTITLNGYVSMPLMENFFGFNVSNGFMSQF